MSIGKRNVTASSANQSGYAGNTRNQVVCIGIHDKRGEGAEENDERNDNPIIRVSEDSHVDDVFHYAALVRYL